MKYGQPYIEYKFTSEELDLVESAIKDPKFEDGEAFSQRSIRKSRIAWIDDPGLDIVLLRMGKRISQESGWNVSLRRCDPIQYTEYDEGGKYDWHIDQAPPMQDHRDGIVKVRKISMTLFLNEPTEYKGGEFDVEIWGPKGSIGNDSRFKDKGNEKERYVTFKSTKGNAIFFQSDQFHRVRPVISGTRKSLVVWFIGPPYV
tara:strand:+ start:44 stop:646 length:603 start_codon:yes stop_codon:yes gene_type:complete